MVKKKLAIMACLLIVILNVSLIVINHSLKNELNLLQDKISNFTTEVKIEKDQLIETLIEKHVIKHPQIALNQSKLSFVAIFPEESCSYLDKEIPYINRLYGNFPELVHVYLLGDENSNLFLESFAAEFPYKVINSSTTVFGNDFYPEAPIYLVIESSGSIQKAYVPDLNSKKRSDEIYQQVSLFLQYQDNV